MGAFLVLLLYVVILLFITIGFVLNIVALVGSIGAGITALFILRIVGIFFPPLGAILGWFF